MRAQSSLYCSVIGRGDPLVLVHGDGLLGNPVDHWWQQLTLADEYQLIMPARPGYYLSPLPKREAFDVYAETIAELLGEGAHLAGHSYGGVVALLAAAQRPEAVYSLTVSEPPAFGLVRGHADVERFIARMQATPVPRSQMAPEAFFLHLYNAVYGHTLQGVSQLPERVRAKLATPLGRRGAEATLREPPPWEADIPLERLAATPFPKLVFSSGALAMHEVVCEVLVQQLAAEHALIRGVVHVVPETGTPFNDRLRAFLSKARGEQMEA
jgi:pimeloyl-ACP methyl ester carboxylesterase